MSNEFHNKDFSFGQQFLDHWRAMPRRDPGGIPYRHDFDPARIKTLLPHTFVGESKDENTFMIRLIGTWIEQFIGKARPNDNVFNNYKPKEKELYKEFLQNIYKYPCVGIMDRSLILNNGEKFSFNSIYCPFNDNLGNPRFIIGVSHLKGTRNWHVDEFAKLLKKSAFNGFEYIDVGYGAPKS